MNYASFWKRFIAMMIDGLILIIPGMLISKLTFGVGGVLIGLFYKPIFEASSLSASPGKALMGMVVLTESGERLTLKKSFIRYACTFISACTMGIGFLMALFTEKKQTLHDLAAGAIVVYRVTPDVNYLHVWIKEMENFFKKISEPDESGYSSSRTAPTREIENLYKLYQSGALTEEEYRIQKEKLLK